MADTTQDERKPEATEDEQKPAATEDERKPEATEDERKPEATEDERKPEATQDEGEPEGEREPEAKDLPEPEEKSAEDLLGRQVVDPHGYKIGKIEELFTHGQNERANWARVKKGLVRTRLVFVPLHDAQVDRGQIRVVYEKEHVNAAPEIEPESQELTDDDADVLHSHYGFDRVKGLTAEADDEDTKLPRETRDADPPTMKERPWAVEKYPLPDMERPEGDEASRPESGREESSDEEPSGGESEEEH